MWTARVTEDGRSALRYVVSRGSARFTYREAIAAWRDDVGFRRWFNGLLEAVPYGAFRWETPGVTEGTADRELEFAVVESAGLDRPATPDVFGEHFEGNSQDDIVRFSNLGGDAILVVPRPIAPNSAYGHLGAFVRSAPDAQRLALWRSVGEEMGGRLDHRPVWLSTAGGGVAWLHVRLDDRPKYYSYAPFRRAP
jgi:hypothetical protein